MTHNLKNFRRSYKAGSLSVCTAFTLIELLVVISIISILIAILLPALAKVRFTALKIKCATQERQLAIAFRMYLSDNNDSFNPPTMTANNRTTQVWSGYTKKLYASGHLARYLSVDVYYCPDSEWQKYSGGLAANQESFKTRKLNAHALTNYAMGIIPIANGVYGNTTGIGYTTTRFQIGIWRKNPAIFSDVVSLTWPAYNKDITNHQVNGDPNGFNVAYLDGHVSWIATDNLESLASSASNVINTGNQHQWISAYGAKRFWRAVSGYDVYNESLP